MSREIGVAMIWLVATAALAADAPVVSPAAKSAAEAITQDSLYAHTRFLSSDLLEGRGPATKGDKLAQEYIATQMEALAPAPAAPGGGWYQKVELIGINGKVPESMTVAKGERKLDFKRLDDFVAFSGTQKPESRIESAELVFVGYGIVAPEYAWDDYKDVDVKGKVLLMMNNDPEDDPKSVAGKTPCVRALGTTSTRLRRRRARPGPSSSTRSRRPVIPGRSSRPPGPASVSSCPTRGAGSRSRGWLTEAASKGGCSLGEEKDLDALRAALRRRTSGPSRLGVSLSMAITNTVQKKETRQTSSESCRT